jgi:hypothetical protein
MMSRRLLCCCLLLLRVAQGCLSTVEGVSSVNLTLLTGTFLITSPPRTLEFGLCAPLGSPCDFYVNASGCLRGLPGGLEVALSLFRTQKVVGRTGAAGGLEVSFESGEGEGGRSITVKVACDPAGPRVPEFSIEGGDGLLNSTLQGETVITGSSSSACPAPAFTPSPKKRGPRRQVWYLAGAFIALCATLAALLFARSMTRGAGGGSEGGGPSEFDARGYRAFEDK